MTHQELLSITLIVHVAVLSGSLAAFYKYGDRSDFMAKSLEGTETTLSKLRMMISSYLLSSIKEFLSTILYPQPILGPEAKI